MKFIIRLALLFGFIFLMEFYAYQAFKTLIKNRWLLIFYIVVNAFILGFIVYSFTKFDRSVGQTPQTMFTLGLLLVVYIPKMVVSIILFGEDFFRFLFGVFKHFAQPNSNSDFLIARRQFVSQIGIGLASIPFLSLLYGIKYGKYNFKVIKQQVLYDDLPEAFDGFRILQISDVHSGSFDNPEKIKYAIDLINEQEADLMLFTGDIVNTHAKEMHPWIEVFNDIKQHKYGKFAVLGNHDYGEYVTWKSAKEKEENFESIKKLYGDIGFQLMLNEHRYISKGQDQIALVGVENWGHNFKKAGDLDLASKHLKATDFKILMSHDPSHWNKIVQHNDLHFHLTLSGHTHGMQFGIEIPGFFKWSPVQYQYEQWAGLYEHKGRHLYVNRGFGFHAYPGRVGIMPEITVIELKKRQSRA
ncbi:metallophosphoesterase [Flavobacterium branchiophilum]|uniref:Phosphoesterase n=1 Tax=Flavobacterium branchiophilum TaxID=55197 RepID=A0A2H3KIQ9_9FLAO|nr:metallophosphoesterase [Flavobacterium branchiophilum]PDS24497.1 phosphoesterase [Flavobacterium branchiophilum]